MIPPSEEEDWLDVQFGRWLMTQRERLGFSLSMACSISQIDYHRLISLEQGEANRGITDKEILSLSKTYNLDVELMVAHALGEVH